ncbi:CARDB domain-containing protein [Actinokineospora soli]|uniref:CARDB domain-containing protein n=1 Tax=Actinokineospora soli TaxID=1048753 RepID=A0ABW2TWY1_9PSEU
MASVTVHQVGAGRADGTSGTLDEHTEVQVFAQVTNDDGSPITLGVNFSVADRTEAVGLNIGPGETQWAQYVVGSLPAGTHPLDVLVYAEVDGMSQVLGQEQSQFTVAGAGAGAGQSGNGGGGYTEQPLPELEITVFEFKAGRVEGMSAGPGEAYDTGGGTLTVQVRNTGTEQSGAAVLTMVVGGEYENHDINLAASEESQFTLTAESLEQGQAEVYAYVAMEINNSTQTVAHESRTIDVIAGPARERAELGTVTVDFSIAMHTTDERGASYLLSSYVAEVTFVGDDGSDVVPSETNRCETEHGPFTCNDIVVPRSGRVIVRAENPEGDVLKGDCHYNLGDKQVLAIDAVQAVHEMELSASSTQELTEQVETEVRAKVSYAFIEAEGGRTWTRGDTESWGEERSGTVLYPLDTLRLEVVE